MEFYYQNAYKHVDNEVMTRRVLSHAGGLMLVEVIFHKAGDDYGLHAHPHEQIAVITKGSFEFINQQTGNVCILNEGDSIYFEPNVVHGGKPLVDGATLLDIFTPQRDDFLT